jgi:hypothetical protein
MLLDYPDFIRLKGFNFSISRTLYTKIVYFEYYIFVIIIAKKIIKEKDNNFMQSNPKKEIDQLFENGHL